MVKKSGKTSGELVNSSTAPPTSTPNQPSNQIFITAFNGFKTVLKVLKETPDGHIGGIIKSTAGLLLAVLEIAENVKGNAEDVRQFQDRLKKLAKHVIGPLQSAKASGTVSAEQEERWERLAEDLNTLKAKLDHLPKGFMARIANSDADKKVLSAANVELDRIIGSSTLEETVAIMKSIDGMACDLVGIETKLDDIIDDSKVDTMLRANAHYDSVLRRGSKRCLEGTRIDMVQTIHDWIDGTSPHKQPIFWLSGEAGTGKSTIAHTIAEDRDKTKQLGASFFFSRNEEARRDADLFVSTIAYQLSIFDQGFKKHLAASLKRDPNLPTKNIKLQLKEMVMKPLKRTETLATSTVVVIVDALDECSPDGAVEILEAWADLTQETPLRLALFITSRPYPHIRDKFFSPNHPSTIFHLHDISQMIVRSDVKRYFRAELDNVLDGGLTKDDLERLLDRAGLLFILAATYIKYLKDPIRKDPLGQLQAILSRKQSSGQLPEGELNTLYLDIPKEMLKDDPRTDAMVMIDGFQKVVRAIVVAGTPMTPIQLFELLKLDRGDVLCVLRRLTSVIFWPNMEDSATVSFFHQSFSEFLTDPTRCTDKRFQIEKSQAHLHMASKCLDAFDEHWKEDPELATPHPDHEAPAPDSPSVSDYLFASDDESTSDYATASEEPQPDEQPYIPDAEEMLVQDSEIPEAISPATSQAYPEYLCYACAYFAYHLQGLVQGGSDDDCSSCLERFEAFYEQKRMKWLDAASGYMRYYQGHEKRSQSVLDQMVSFQLMLLSSPPPAQDAESPHSQSIPGQMYLQYTTGPSASRSNKPAYTTRASNHVVPPVTMQDVDRFDTAERWYHSLSTRILKELENRRIDPTCLTRINEIGEGGYAKVYRATWSTLTAKDEGQAVVDVAVKEILPKEHKSTRLILRFVRELRHWSTLDHPHILKFLGFHVDPDQKTLYFVAPYCPGGSVRRRLNESTVSMDKRERWVINVTQGLHYLHSLDPPTVHGDLKADNVLVSNTGDAVLCDFGLSAVVEDCVSTGLTTSEGFKGSTRWCSQEIFNGNRRTTATDVWAWSLTVLEIMTGRVPFESQKTEVAVMMRVVRSKLVPSYDEYPELHRDNPLWNLIYACLKDDASDRATMQHCWTNISAMVESGGRFVHSTARYTSPASSRSNSPAAPIRPPNKKALLIGIEYWDDLTAGVVKINSAHTDVDTWFGIITNQYGYRPGDITCLRDVDDAHPDTWPTYQNIARALEHLADDVRPDDKRFLFLACHGVQVDVTSALLELDNTDEGIVTRELNDVLHLLKDNLVRRLLMDKIPSGATLTAVVDTCHSGTLLDLPWEVSFDPSGIPVPTHAQRWPVDLPGSIISVSTCKDDQESQHMRKKGDPNQGIGALTFQFKRLMQTARPNMIFTIPGIVDDLTTFLKQAHRAQHPVITCGNIQATNFVFDP